MDRWYQILAGSRYLFLTQPLYCGHWVLTATWTLTLISPSRNWQCCDCNNRSQHCKFNQSPWNVCNHAISSSRCLQCKTSSHFRPHSCLWLWRCIPHVSCLWMNITFFIFHMKVGVTNISSSNIPWKNIKEQLKWKDNSLDKSIWRGLLHPHVCSQMLKESTPFVHFHILEFRAWCVNKPTVLS